MKRKLYIIALVILIVVAGYSIWRSERLVEAPSSLMPLADNPRNGTYRIAGVEITLANGRAETEVAPGSASVLITQYFGNEAAGDINADGIADTIFLVTQSVGGSGTFFYIVGATQQTDGYQGTNAILLGDRIAPQSTEIRNGIIIAHYADRAPGESFATQPSRGVSKYISFENGELKEIAKPAGF